jgi:integrase
VRVARINFALSSEQRLDARRALTVLEGSGLTLEGAALRALAGKRAAVHIKISEAVDRFHLSRVRKLTRRGVPLRPSSIIFYEEKLAPLLNSAFADRMFDSVTRPEFKVWLASLKTGDAMRSGIARACRALWRWGMAEDPPLATVDVTEGATFAAPLGNDFDRRVLSVVDVRAILDAATWARSALALMLFAGVRPEEVRGKRKPPLLWSHVSKKEKWIRIPAEIAKNGHARLLEGLPDAVWRWLTPGTALEPVAPHSERSIREAAQGASALAGKWPQDAFRHTAATYLLAATQDAGLVAGWLGWEDRPALLFQTYRGRITTAGEQVNQKMGRDFLALRPTPK